MARDTQTNKVNKRIQDIASNVQDNMDSLYKTTYFSTPQGKNDVRDISKSINDNIDGIVNRNMSTFGMPSVSVLYSRMFNKSSDNGSNPINGINQMFEDPMMMDDLYSTFMSNRFIKELDEEIDTVCKYMPELEDALETKKDSVLSADHFSKDFLNIKFPTDISNENFSQRVNEMKKKYKLQKLVEEIYEDTAKYGEKFVYCVPYSTAITRLLATKPDATLNPPTTRMESFTESEFEDAIKEGSKLYTLKMTSSESTISDSSGVINRLQSPTVMKESSVYTDNNSNKKQTVVKPESILSQNEQFTINIEINNTGIIDSAIKEAADTFRINSKRSKSLKESFAETIHANTITEDKTQPEAKGNLNFNNVLKSEKTASDGLITGNGLSDDKLKKYKVNVPGAVVKVLKREYVIPIYIEKSCMGYYYIELRTKDAGDEIMGFRNLLGDPMTNMGSEGRVNFNNVDSMRQDETIKYVAGQLSQFIDKKFVNSNQDLAKEIYEILKYNELFNTPSIDRIKVTFIPPEDIHHFYFTFDEDSHRGVSDLARGLIPAKLYSSLYITNSIGIMTRGQDKRVYYVKQSVDTNIAQQLMNVINQIKMGNFGIRQFNSINTILNITGKFNDYVIPRGPSGDDPISVDVISGQQFDIHTDLMDILKEMAIGSTGVPLDIIQARHSIDYATQLSMSNSKFLRTVYKRQERYQEDVAPLITSIYNYEYGENSNLDISFPPPVFLDMVNTNQLITNIRDFVDSIIDIEMQEEQDNELKTTYRNNLFMHYMGTHIDISAHNNILEKTRAEIKVKQKESEIATPTQPEEDYSSSNEW